MFFWIIRTITLHITICELLVTGICIFTPPRLFARRAAIGGSSQIAPVLPAESGLHLKTGWWFLAHFRTCFDKAMLNSWLRSLTRFVSTSPSLANQNKENPHIAILTSGAGSKSYFEDSFLARHLGFTMVETNDLVVRSGSVMLKTLAGLLPIDVIFQRKPDNSLDPLELGGSGSGVPGILQVIRDGKIAIANAPGSGLVESPIFMAFMPRICKALLKTDLLLPGIATWWGGEAKSLRLMIDRIDDIHLLPAFRDRSSESGPTSTTFNQPQPESLSPETMSRDERIRLLLSNPNSGWGRKKSLVHQPQFGIMGTSIAATFRCEHF